MLGDKVIVSCEHLPVNSLMGIPLVVGVGPPSMTGELICEQVRELVEFSINFVRFELHISLCHRHWTKKERYDHRLQQGKR